MVAETARTIESNSKQNAAQGILGSRWGILALGLVLILVVGVRIHLSDIPLERDEGEYAYAGQLMLEGIAPFSRAYNMKLPGIYMAYAAIMALLGQTHVAIHLGLLIVNVATCILVLFLGRRLWDDMTGFCGAIFFAILSLSPDVDGVFANSEHFVLLPALGGILLLFYALDSGKRLAFLAAGILMGLGFTIKQHGVFFILFGVFTIVVTEWRRSNSTFRKSLLHVLIFVVGAALPYLLLCVIMWKAGVFDRFWFWTVTYAREYVSQIPLSMVPDILVYNHRETVANAFVIWLLAVTGLLYMLVRVRSDNRSVPAIAFLLFSVASVCPGLYFRSHYFILLVPAISICAGVTVSALWKSAKEKISVPVAGALVGIITIVAVSWVCYSCRQFLFQSDSSTASRMVHGANPFPESLIVADYLAQNTSPDDTVAVLGSEPQIFFYSQRKSATGFIYTYPLTEGHPFASELQREMAREIVESKPKYLLYVHVSTSWGWTNRSDRFILRWFEKYTKDFCELVGTVKIVPPSPTVYDLGQTNLTYPPKTEYWLALFRRRTPS
ncbi:hypothetical protein Desti_1819 [Desulfomonile tiedjei DSM 6799]|uniref:Glycosyltransferase RgtA/B/C/D-like domain-containing protein n=2 Tax=Desulfomonile tiedjei TaxID=2358 RepID=I4C4N6_DESTA|nr:hypothetical protein Desti_1819 [Desulfomonile tiedjei DSM 6799]